MEATDAERLEDAIHRQGKLYIKVNGEVISAYELYRRMIHNLINIQNIDISSGYQFMAMRIYRNDPQWRDRFPGTWRPFTWVIGTEGNRSSYRIELGDRPERTDGREVSHEDFDNVNQLPTIIVRNYPLFYTEVRASILSKLDDLERIIALGDSTQLPADVLGSNLIPMMIGDTASSLENKERELRRYLDILDNMRGIVGGSYYNKYNKYMNKLKLI